MLPLLRHDGARVPDKIIGPGSPGSPRGAAARSRLAMKITRTLVALGRAVPEARSRAVGAQSLRHFRATVAAGARPPRTGPSAGHRGRPKRDVACSSCLSACLPRPPASLIDPAAAHARALLSSHAPPATLRAPPARPVARLRPRAARRDGGQGQHAVCVRALLNH